MKNQPLFSLLVLFFFLSIRPASSQTIEFSMVPDSVSSLEFDHTRLLFSDTDQSIISGLFNLQYKHVLNDKFNLIGETSFMHFKESGSDAENGISNVYLGIQYKTSKSAHINSALNAGIHLPTSKRDAQIGQFFNFFDLGKFAHKTTAINIGYNTFINYDSGFRLGFEFGSEILIPVGSNNGDTDILGKYGVSLMYQTTSGLYFQTELLGVANITNEGGDFDDSTFHTYAIGAGYNGDKVGAGLYYRNYFDEFFGDDFNGILGLEINFFL